MTKFFDRATTNVPKCQIGFINIIVSPLVEAFADFLQAPLLTTAPPLPAATPPAQLPPTSTSSFLTHLCPRRPLPPQLPTLTDCLQHNRDVMEAEAEAGSFTSRPPQPAGTAPPSAD